MGCSPHGGPPRPGRSSIKKGNTHMLMTIAIVLLVLYALGMATSVTAGGLIHILLVLAAVMVLVRLLQERPVV